MLGKWVVEVSFVMSAMFFWVGYFLGGDISGLLNFAEVLDEHTSAGLMCSVVISILSSVLLVFWIGDDSLAIEVLRPWGCMILGGGFASVGLLFPFVFFGELIPVGSGGFTSKIFMLGKSSPVFLSILSSCSFSLGGLGVHIFIKGVLAFFIGKSVLSMSNEDRG